MAELVFDCVDVRADPYAAAPTLKFRVRISDVTGAVVHAIALRCQFRIEPGRRRYSPEEAERLRDLFGDPSRFAETLKPMQFAEVSVMVPGFSGSLETDLPVPCSYDLEVAQGAYFHALIDGGVPLLLLFSGTIFLKSGSGFQVQQVPWHKEAECLLPVATWQALMDIYFPNSTWLRLSRDTVDALRDFKAARALATWDQTMEQLLQAGEAEQS